MGGSHGQGGLCPCLMCVQVTGGWAVRMGGHLGTHPCSPGSLPRPQAGVCMEHMGALQKGAVSLLKVT